MASISKSVLLAAAFVLFGGGDVLADWSREAKADTSDQSPSADPHWVMDEVSHCLAYDSHAGSDDSVTWSGGCGEGKLSGQGTATFSDHGHMFEKVTGNFSGGFLQDGHVSIVWADGSKYEGEAQDGRFNGLGTLISADGTQYKGLWENDSFKGAANARPDRDSSSDRAEASTDGGRGASQKADSQPATANDVQAPRENPDDASHDASQWAFLGNSLGATLVAVDGSRLTLQAGEDDTLKETIVRPDGATLFEALSPLSTRIGTVQDNTNKVVATYRLQDNAIAMAFDDGRSQTIVPNAAGGITVDDRSPSASGLVTDWYPEGHAFSRAERDAALKQYASRLSAGTAEESRAATPDRRNAHARASRKRHARVAAQHPAVVPAPVPAPAPAPASAPPTAAAHAPKVAEAPSIPQPSHLPNAKPHAVMPAQTSRAPAQQAPGTHAAVQRLPILPLEPLIVRTSEIHTIDAPLAKRGASSCLKVESDGAHWGFRNHCDDDVQFAYCVMNGKDRLADCGAGAISGSVAGNGYSTLVADSSLSDVDSTRAFRWVACVGGAGEVVARLDQSDPPMGRCLHGGDASTEMQRADAGPRAR